MTNHMRKFLQVIAALFLIVLILLGPNFYSRWIHGWGTACEAYDVTDDLSPSQEWIARKQLVECSGFGSGFYGTEVALVRAHTLFPFLAREQEVFSRAKDGWKNLTHDEAMQLGSHDVKTKWKDDHNLEIDIVTHGKSEYGFTTSVQDINITVVTMRDAEHSPTSHSGSSIQ